MQYTALLWHNQHNAAVFLPANVRDLIIPTVLRRVHVPRLAVGEVQLDKSAAHHLRDVLRLKTGDQVEIFDDLGASAASVISRCDVNVVAVDVREISSPAETQELIIASAIPKGERADWMIEKLSELG